MGYLRFIDINSPDFSLDHKYGITDQQAMEKIHALKVMVPLLSLL